jgi:hypothetical protein
MRRLEMLPNAKERKEIFANELKQRKNNLKKEDTKEIVLKSEGYEDIY